MSLVRLQGKIVLTTRWRHFVKECIWTGWFTQCKQKNLQLPLKGTFTICSVEETMVYLTTILIHDLKKFTCIIT